MSSPQDPIAQGLLDTGQEPSWWWNPNNPLAIREVPEEIEKFLFATDPDLKLTFNSKRKCWQLYQAINTNREAHQRLYMQWATGYRKLADLTDDKDVPLGLTLNLMTGVLAKILAKTYGGNGKICTTIEERGKKRKDDFYAERAQIRKDFSKLWARHMRPSVGYGSSNGSKSANFGTGVA